jgi:hypothetical protein
MSLEKWVEYGWLRRETTSPGEIKDLLGIVERSLAEVPRSEFRRWSPAALLFTRDFLLNLKIGRIVMQSPLDGQTKFACVAPWVWI